MCVQWWLNADPAPISVHLCGTHDSSLKSLPANTPKPLFVDAVAARMVRVEERSAPFRKLCAADAFLAMMKRIERKSHAALSRTVKGPESTKPREDEA
jgi:hypothetical protein